ncbi:MAG: TonB family protein [Syntrophales bacterium]|nr:TonB family protein [Syntrophales bacterium]
MGQYSGFSEKEIGIVSSIVLHLLVFSLFFIAPAIGVSTRSDTIHVSLVSYSDLRRESDLSRRETVKKSIPKLSDTVPDQGRELPYTSPMPVKDVQSVELEKKDVVPSDVTAGVSSKDVTSAAGFSASGLTVLDTSFGNSEGPKFLHQEKPVYPFLAKRLGREGHVVLRLFIDKHGVLRHVEVVQPGELGFTEAAIEAVKRSTFIPAIRNGKHVDCRALLTVWFKLE